MTGQNDIFIKIVTGRNLTIGDWEQNVPPSANCKWGDYTGQ